MCRNSDANTGKTTRFDKTNKPKHVNARPYKRDKRRDWSNSDEDV